jgi:hypothetical protein
MKRLRNALQGWLVEMLDGRFVLGPLSVTKTSSLLDRERAAFDIGRRVERGFPGSVVKLGERLGTIVYYSTPEWSRVLVDRVPFTVARKASIRGGEKRAFDVDVDVDVSFGLRMAADRAQDRGHPALRAKLETLAHVWPTLEEEEEEPVAPVHRLPVEARPCWDASSPQRPSLSAAVGVVMAGASPSGHRESAAPRRIPMSWSATERSCCRGWAFWSAPGRPGWCGASGLGATAPTSLGANVQTPAAPARRAGTRD